VSDPVCPVCLLPECKRPHPDCSPPKLRCVRCGERLLVRSVDGLCGFCHEEMAARARATMRIVPRTIAGRPVSKRWASWT
jgi:hypothetical protein